MEKKQPTNIKDFVEREWNDNTEGDWKNDKFEGKGIYYFNDGDRQMGDYLNDNPIGKHVTLTINGEVEVNNYN